MIVLPTPTGAPGLCPETYLVVTAGEAAAGHRAMGAGWCSASVVQRVVPSAESHLAQSVSGSCQAWETLVKVSSYVSSCFLT